MPDLAYVSFTGITVVFSLLILLYLLIILQSKVVAYFNRFVKTDEEDEPLDGDREHAVIATMPTPEFKVEKAEKESESKGFWRHIPTKRNFFKGDRK